MYSVSFVTSCWEGDWREILLSPHYLRLQQIENQAFHFLEKLLVINNVKNPAEVLAAAQIHIDQGTLTRVVHAEAMEEEVLSHFKLCRSDFSSDWQFYNARAPLTAIYAAKGECLLYLTGDVFLEKRVNWIQKALVYMERHPKCKVANLTWNKNYREAKQEAYRTGWNFYVSKEGFSDQMFLVRRADFLEPMYGEIREDTAHFPRGDVWERRVFSYMKNRGWERITYRWGSYTHQNFRDIITCPSSQKRV